DLEEPLRSTLAQRYFEGRSAAAIAAASGVPASTVRARVARGLELLRERLDREKGSRAAWMALVAPLLPRPTAPAVTASTLASGALTMTLAKSVLVASAAAVAGLAWWSLAPRITPSEPVALAATEVPVEPAALLTADAVRVDVPDPAARIQAVAEAPAPEPEPAAPEGPFADDMRGGFDARVVDERGAPWAGAELRVSTSIARSDQVLARAVSGLDGHVQLELVLPKWTRNDRDSTGGAAASFDLVVRRAGCASRHLEVVVREDDVTHLGEIVLVEAGSVRGRVVDEHGAAVADARVGALAAAAFEALDERARDRIVRVGSSVLDGLLARSVRPDGTFELDDVAPGPVHLWAHAPGRRYALTGPVDVVAGDTEPEVVLVLPLLAETDRIAGRVVGPDGRGRPASLGVDVGRGAERRMFFMPADMEGRFEFAVEEVDAVYALTAHDGYDEFTPKRVDGVRPGDLEITIALGLGTRLEVRVADVDGAAVPGADIRISTSMVTYSAKATALEPGEYEMDLPDGAFQVEVAAAGFRDARSAPFEAGAVPSEI
ncbi:MAG TPA: hypothetical protein VMT18_14540, partial [Planctomycetota bacterium]|nr:hypothetical protein [Planctomycetota bacterium]